MENKNVQYEQHADYLEVTLEGERNYSNLTEVWLSLLAKCDSLKLYKILITTKMTGSLSLIQYYNIFDKIRENRIILKYQIAGVFENTPQTEIDKFDRIISQNEGWKVRLFNNTEKARHWLLS